MTTDVPDELKTTDRRPDQSFSAEESLFRRFRPEDLDGIGISLDAIELPDMSVNREKYSKPEWAILDEDFHGWGVASFRVADVPTDLLHLGQIHYTFAASLQPLKNNYAHTEIRAYKDGMHIDLKHQNDLDPEPHLRWRQRLAWKIRVRIWPLLGNRQD